MKMINHPNRHDRMTTISVFYHIENLADLENQDKKADEIVSGFHGSNESSGYFLPTATRDIQYKVKRSCAAACRVALQEAGFDVSGTAAGGMK